MPTRSPADTVARRAAQVQTAREHALTAWQQVTDATIRMTGLVGNHDNPHLTAARQRVDTLVAAAQRASADLTDAQRLLRAAITRRETAAREAGSSLMSVREIAAALRTHLDATRTNGVDPYLRVTANGRDGKRDLTIDWTGAPTQDEVKALITAALAEVTGGTDQQVTVGYARTLLWACGNLHDDAQDAFTAHEADERGLLVWDDYINEKVLPEVVREGLLADGDLVSRCIPGEYATCPLCGGSGGSVAYHRAATAHRPGQPWPAREACTACDDQRVLDLADPTDRARYDAAVAEARALAAARA